MSPNLVRIIYKKKRKEKIEKEERKNIDRLSEWLFLLKNTVIWYIQVLK